MSEQTHNWCDLVSGYILDVLVLYRSIKTVSIPTAFCAQQITQLYKAAKQAQNIFIANIGVEVASSPGSPLRASN